MQAWQVTALLSKEILAPAPDEALREAQAGGDVTWSVRHVDAPDERVECVAEFLHKEFGPDSYAYFNDLSQRGQLEWRRKARTLLSRTLDLNLPEETPNDVETRNRLAEAMDEHGIQPSADYEHEDLIAVVQGTGAVPRYLAITHDETYSFGHLVDTVEEACASLAASLGESTGGSITGILDLGTGKRIEVDVNVTVTPKD